MADDEDSPLALVNARVWTFDSDLPSATALRVEGGRITAVGTAEDVAGPEEARVVDCRGATVLPGFVDGHCHFELTCLTTDWWINVHTPPLRSLDEVAGAIRQALAAEPARDDWILCRSSFAMQDKVVEGRLFTRHELDALEPERPLAVFASLHVASLNTAAFRRLGLWAADSTHPFFGYVHRAVDGTPTGVVTEVFMMVPPPGGGTEFHDSVTRHARDLFNAAGTTMVNSMPENLGQVEELRATHARRGLSLRHRYYLISPGVATLDEAEELSRIDTGDDWFRFGGVKVFVNGCCHDGLGQVLDDQKWTQGQLDDFVRDADRRGLQVWMHSLDAEGVRMAARAILQADRGGRNLRRHRIEHGGDFIDLQDVELVRSSGALLVTTPQFLHSMTTDPTGPRAPLRSLLRAGVPVLGGTDSTGTVPSSVSILGNVDTAVNRRRADGSTFHVEEAVGVEEAVALFTVHASHGTFAEGRAGRIVVGAPADLVFLGDDPRTCPREAIKDIEVRQTFVGGCTVWGA